MEIKLLLKRLMKIRSSGRRRVFFTPLVAIVIGGLLYLTFRGLFYFDLIAATLTPLGNYIALGLTLLIVIGLAILIYFKAISRQNRRYYLAYVHELSQYLHLTTYETTASEQGLVEDDINTLVNYAGAARSEIIFTFRLGTKEEVFTMIQTRSLEGEPRLILMSKLDQNSVDLHQFRNDGGALSVSNFHQQPIIQHYYFGDKLKQFRYYSNATTVLSEAAFIKSEAIANMLKALEEFATCPLVITYFEDEFIITFVGLEINDAMTVFSQLDIATLELKLKQRQAFHTLVTKLPHLINRLLWRRGE